MEIFQQLQRKISEKKMNSRFSKGLWVKAFALHQATVAARKSQLDSPIVDSIDSGTIVSQPPPNVRLIIFNENENCDRPKLFDSKFYQKNETTCPKKYQRAVHDDILPDMVFGSVGMAQKAALKIHYIKRSRSIMLSRVFCLTSREGATASLDRGIENYVEMQRANSIFSRRKANTMPVPSPVSTPCQSLASSFTSSTFPRTDSGISLSSMSSSSCHTGPPSYYAGSLGTGSMCSVASASSRAHSLPKNKRDSFAVSEDTPVTPNEKLLRRNRTKIGFAVICEPEPSNLEAFQRFFFEHFPLIESHMNAVKDGIEQVLNNPLIPKASFNNRMMKALDDFSLKLSTLYSSSRLPEPVWPTLTNPALASSDRVITVNSFIGDLSRLVSDYNTKQKNCFFTSLLTAVLTYHLGWVASVTSSEASEDGESENEYNALWAQLGDLYGAVGAPTKVCRTVVTGNCHELVSTFLSVLSYFIRSSRLDDVIDVPSEITPLTLGVEEPFPNKSVTLDYIPSEIDDSDYVLVTVQDDKADKNEKSETVSFPICSSPAKSTILRSKSSPSKTKKEDSCPVARRHSGTAEKRNRPRSNAITESKHSVRLRTFSNNILTKKSVQSRRKSHDAPDATTTVTATSHHSGFQWVSSHTKQSSRLSTQVSLGVNDSCLNEQNTQSDIIAQARRKPTVATRSESSAEDFRPCQLASFADIIEPPVERVVNVQRDCTAAETIRERPTELFLPGKKDDFLTIENFEADFFVPSDFSKECDRTTPSEPTSKRPSKAKVVPRRRKLPNAAMKERDAEQSQQVSTHKARINIPYYRIPSVEMNHTQFDEYFDPKFSTSLSMDELSSPSTVKETCPKELTVVASPTHHVTSCPNFVATFASTKPQNNFDDFTNETPKFESLYPKLSLDSEDTEKTSSFAEVSPVTSRLYPSLPVESNFDAITIHSSDKVHFNRKRSQLSSPASPLSPTRSAPMPPLTSPSRLSSVRSTRTVTVTDDMNFEDNLKELPVAGMDYSTSNKKDQDSSAATGFANLMADYNQEYMSDFVLHGTPNHPNMQQKILSDLAHGIKNSALDEPVSEAVCIVADTDTCSVKVYRSHRLLEDPPCLPALTSKLVNGILYRVAAMAKMKMSPEFCMSHLESELRQLVLKSHVLAAYTLGRKRVTMSQLSAALGIESQDLPLLMSIASCHSPRLNLPVT